MYDHTFYKQVQISRSDIRPHIKWAVSLVILHMVTSIFLRALCGYIWVTILTLSPRGEKLKEKNTDYKITWKTLGKAQSYSNQTKKCNLCLLEKFFIICHPDKATLNKKSELISHCGHMSKFLLSNTPTAAPD